MFSFPTTNTKNFVIKFFLNSQKDAKMDNNIS